MRVCPSRRVTWCHITVTSHSHLTGGMELRKMLPNLQLARGWSDLAEPREWEEQQVWYCWEEQSTLRHSRRNLYREYIAM